MKPSTMTDEQLHIKVAELLGRELRWMEYAGGPLLHTKPKRGGIPMWLAPDNFRGERDDEGVSIQPDWLNDLNACAEFRRVVPNLPVYYGVLARVVRDPNTSATLEQMVEATARQRCEAFVEVMEGR